MREKSYERVLEEENAELKAGNKSLGGCVLQLEKDKGKLNDEIAELKKEIKQIIERERVVPEHYLIEMIEKNKELNKKLKEDAEDLANINIKAQNFITELKKQNEKMKNFIFEEFDICFYCPLTDTCNNDEGTCPYANITEEEQKKLLSDWITK